MEMCWIFFSWFCLFVAQLSTGNASRIIRGYHSLLFVIKKKGFTLQYKHLYGSPTPPPPPPTTLCHPSNWPTTSVKTLGQRKESNQNMGGTNERQCSSRQTCYNDLVTTYLPDTGWHPLKSSKKFKYKFSSIFSFYTLKQIEGENKR